MANTIDTDAKIIAADRWGFGQPTICRCSSTLMFAAHINDSSQLEIHKSTDDGLNWSLVKTFTETDPADFEMAAIDSSSAGIVFMFTGNDYKVYVTTNSGSTWIQKHYINGTGCVKAHLIYGSIENRLYLSSRDGTTTYIAYSTDKGDNWTNTYHVVGTSSDHIADMDISPYNGDVYIVAITDVGGTKVYKYDKNGNYISVSSIGGNNDTDGCIAIDSNGNRIVIVGYRYNYPDYLYSLGIYQNESLTGNLIPGVAIRPWIAGSVSIGIDGDDNVYAFYTKISDEKTYYRKYNGATWESEVILVGVANDRISCEKRPIAGSNRLHFVYYKAP